MPYIGNQPAPQNVTSLEITDGTITNADINASAAIDISKLNGVTATNTELNKLDGYTGDVNDLNTVDVTTLGTVEASKVVTADANGDVNFGSGNIVVDTTTFKIDSLNNRIGIGTASPTNPVHVKVSGAAATILAESDAGYDVQYRFEQGGVFTGAVGYDDSEAKVYLNRYGNATTGLSVDVNGDTIAKGELIADSYNETYVALSGTTPTVNCESGNVFALSTSGNTTFTFSNPPASGTAYGFTLKLTAGGTHTITYPASVDWAGATAPDAPASGETDLLVFTTMDGGTTWYGAIAIDAAG